MYRLLVGTCVLALAVVAVRAEDKNEKKSVKDTYDTMFKELLGKFQKAASKEAKDKVVTEYSDKFVDLAKSNPKDVFSVNILSNVLNFPMPDTKDGPKVKALALLKGYIDDPKADKKVRVKAFKGYMGAQEKIITAAGDAKAVDAAKKEMETYRKLIKTDFKGEVKDLYVGGTMPELTSKNLEDKEVKLSDLKGKVVVLDVWATWCPPCRAMIPHSRELVKKLKDKPFVLVSISADAKKDTLTDFMKDNEMPWTHWWAGQRGPAITALDIQYFPTIYVLDHKGVIRAKDVRGDDMDKVVEKLLKEMEDEKKAKTE